MTSRRFMRSRWTGPIAVTTAISGTHHEQSDTNLAGSVGPHLGDEDPRPVGEVLVDRARQAGAIVEAARRDDDPVVTHELGEVVLRRRLAVGAGDGDDAGLDLAESCDGLVDELLGPVLFVGLECAGREVEDHGHGPHHDRGREPRSRRDQSDEGDRDGHDRRDDRGRRRRGASIPTARCGP